MGWGGSSCPSRVLLGEPQGTGCGVAAVPTVHQRLLAEVLAGCRNGTLGVRRAPCPQPRGSRDRSRQAPCLSVPYVDTAQVWSPDLAFECPQPRWHVCRWSSTCSRRIARRGWPVPWALPWGRILLQMVTCQERMVFSWALRENLPRIWGVNPHVQSGGSPASASRVPLGTARSEGTHAALVAPRGAEGRAKRCPAASGGERGAMQASGQWCRGDPTSDAEVPAAGGHGGMSRYKTLWFLVRSGAYFSVGEECWTTIFTF